MRHRLNKQSVNSFSIPSKPSSSVFKFSVSSPLSVKIISKIASRMPSPALSSNKASTSSSLAPTPASSPLADPSNTTLLAILAVSNPARRGSVNKTKDSIPSLRASTRSFLMRDAAIFKAFKVFSTGVSSVVSPSVLRPGTGAASSSAENEEEPILGRSMGGDDIGGGRERDGLARFGRLTGDGLAGTGLLGGDKLGKARIGCSSKGEGGALGLERVIVGLTEEEGKFGLARPGLARPGLARLGLVRLDRPTEARGWLVRSLPKCLSSPSLM
mmetsp:Transcript_42032/g.71865  ORF Transcript_42032/g.71865 Transcript_42032/m.71865 type:complete len:272 (-) Transcript_42032:1094-1909(-)